jgi:hypothetical protein
MRRVWTQTALLTTFIAGTSVVLPGQQQADQKPISFEVASVKPNPSRIGVRGHSFPGDRFEARNVPLRDLGNRFADLRVGDCEAKWSVRKAASPIK